jgi:cell division protein FtsB
MARDVNRMNKRRRNEKIISMAEAREKRKARRALQKSWKNATPRRKNRIFVYRKFYIAALLFLLVMASVYAVRIAALKTDETRATAALAAAQDKKARLESELEHIDDPAYIEQQARTRLRMIKPGEIYYVLPERGDAANAERDGADDAADAEGADAE